jgi:cytochrome-b5 reductase
VQGPYIKYPYVANQWKHIGLLAGGTGITPMYQLIQEVLADPTDNTAITLLYASRTPEDIILKAELDALAIVHPNLKVVYTVTTTNYEEGKTFSLAHGPWAGNVGFITRDMLETYLPKPAGGAEVKVLVCGPPPFYAAYSGEKKSPSDQGVLSGFLAEMGYSQEQVFKY